MNGFELLEPTSLTETVRLLAERGDGTKLIGGGTALVVLMKQGMYQPDCLISTARVPELQRFEFSESGGLRIGGGVCHHDIGQSPIVRERYPLLAKAVDRVGNIRVRQMATIAGNLSHSDYMADPPAALLALGARVVLVSAEGQRTLGLDEFILGPYATAIAPGEVLAEVQIPTPAAGTVFTYLKFAVPTETERPTLNVAIAAVPEGAALRQITLVLGAVAGPPVRITSVESMLQGRTLSAELMQEAAEATAATIDPIDDGRLAVWYKRDVTRVLVRRALEDVASQLAIRNAP